MTDAFDLSTLFFLALAVIIFLRLRSVLGRRTGSERPPFDPYSRRDLPAESDEKTGEAKVISMPGTPRIEDADAALREDGSAPVWQGHAEAGTPLAEDSRRSRGSTETSPRPTSSPAPGSPTRRS
jgi:predicted lipid-binding transport protein (Tim44 family)